MIALLVLTLPAPLLAPPSTSQAGAAEAGSLEALLARVRAERATARERLRLPVERVLARIEALGPKGAPPERRRLRLELESFGPEAAPLLLEHVDPGPDASEARRFRSSEVVEALVRLESGAITDGLLSLARGGTPLGRRHAVRLLGHAPDGDRIRADLEGLFAASKGELRLAVVGALARVGGSGATLRSALRDPDKEVRRAVLTALANARSAEARPDVLLLAQDPALAAPVAAELLTYYRALPEVVDEAALDALVELAVNPRPTVDTRVQVLDALPTLNRNLDQRLERRLDELTESRNGVLREAAQVCLALFGDRGAQRDLKHAYDELVDKNKNSASMYQKRGDMLLRLHEYGDAADDYERSVELLERNDRFVSKELRVSLARAYALANRLRQAHEVLVLADLDEEWLAQLAADPDFAELRASSRFGKLFE